MDHLLFTFTFIGTSYILSAFHLDVLSIVLQLVLLLILQYLYYLMTIHEPPLYQYFQHCVSCGKMTPQHYVHCTKCKLCVPVLYSHFNDIGMCTSTYNYKRYNMLKRLMVGQQLIVTMFMVYTYPMLSVLPFVQGILLYKTF